MGMGPLTPTSIARVQATLSALAGPPSQGDVDTSHYSARDLQDLEALKPLQKPLLSAPINAHGKRPEAPMRLHLQHHKLALGNFRQADTRAPQSLAALLYAAYDVDPDDGGYAPVLDLIA